MKKILLLFLLLIFGIFLVNADSNGIWHNAEDVRGGVFGSDEIVTNYTFQNDIYFEERIFAINFFAINNDGISFRTNDGNRRLFISDNGNIGIGNSNPQVKLDVNGSLRIRENLNCDFTYTDSNGIIKCGNVGKELNFSNGVLSFNQSYLVEVLGTISGGGSLYKGPLVNEIHTTNECKGANGIVYEVNESGNKVYFCKFSENSCPNGWTKYKDWTSTTSNSCNANFIGSKNGYPCVSQSNSCFSSSHAFSDKTIESCNYYSGGVCYGGENTKRVEGLATLSCISNIIEIGCY